MSLDDETLFKRPYLVVPKLIEQPTWGGQYIASVKGWLSRSNLDKINIGQSYELFSGSNLSLLDDSSDIKFSGEITDRSAVQLPTKLDNALPLDELTKKSPEKILGPGVVKSRGPRINILIKYTQAKGNSFQVHIKAGVKHDKWKAKPESWYYFEPGLVTLGVKQGANWDKYKEDVEIIDKEMRKLGEQVSSSKISFEAAQSRIAEVIKLNSPWKYVNLVEVKKDQLIDLSGGGLHHSWEEDEHKIPLGNVLLELQSEAMDDISTFRNFDKGKMGQDGSVRQLHIDNYFQFIDRSDETNNPANHVIDSQVLNQNASFKHELMLETPLYNMDKLTLFKSGYTYEASLDRFKHLFVKAGRIKVSTAAHSILVARGHSCFIPASAERFLVESLADNTEVIISY